ncbi:zeta toxin family protein [Rhizobium tumorigenes]|uniref:Zeta toxin family protein n=1 Tax=Rhizobium tumorigenes TaxID=2041385 RepID=A0AAF1KSG7_9HYPH|nr:zeta toxin family protein [Rhizobium tumorigenes]WFR98220.1 zeta toxin family protein [Rhizobium tumorigenes]WFS03732.1 zeta toxin family protein [Rhizobium tumorigenes]
MKDDLRVDRSVSLSPPDRQEIFENQIIPAIGAFGPPVAKPTFAVVSGQPGAGKSTMVRQIRSRFGSESTQLIIPDDLNAYIPGNNTALMNGSHLVERQNSSAITEWYHKLFDRGIENKANIILESCYSPHQYRSLLKKARLCGYKTELNIVATDRITSFTAIHDRFEKAIEKRYIASSVLTDADTHDHYYSMWPRVAFDVENNKTFDKIAIVTRDGATVFENEQVAGNSGASTWERKPDALRALMNVRNRPLEERQQHWVGSVWSRLCRSAAFAQHPDSADLPVTSFQRGVALRLAEQSDLSSHKTKDDFLREFSRKFSMNLQRDIALIGSHKSKRGEFQKETFEEAFSERMASVHRSLQHAITTEFQGVIAKSNEVKKARIWDGSGFRGDALAESSTTKRLQTTPDKKSITQIADGFESHDQRPPSVNQKRPKFLVEVKNHFHRPIELNNQMARDPDRSSNLPRETVAVSLGPSEARANAPVISRRNNGDFRIATRYLRELPGENPDRRSGEPGLLSDLATLGTTRPRESQHPSEASGSVTQRQGSLDLEFNTISPSSPVNGETRLAHLASRQGLPEAGMNDVQTSADRASQESSASPDATSVSTFYSGPPAEWFGRDTGYETDRNSGDIISASTQRLEELEDSAVNLRFGHEAQGLSAHVTTAVSGAEASSHSPYIEILDGLSSARSDEQGRGGDGGAAVRFSHDLAPHANILPQTSPDDFPDFPEFTDTVLAEIDAACESLSKKPSAVETIVMDLHKPRFGDAFQKVDVSERNDMMPANQEPLIGKSGGHPQQAPSSSGAEFDDDSWLTTAALEEIDAIIKSHWDKSLRVPRAAVECIERKMCSTIPTRPFNEHPPKVRSSLQPRLEDFPDLTEAQWLRVEHSARAAITAVQNGQQQVAPGIHTRSGFGNSSAPSVGHPLVTPAVSDVDHTVSLSFQGAEHIYNKLVESTHPVPTMDSSSARNDLASASDGSGNLVAAKRRDDLGRPVMSTPVGDVKPSASGSQGPMANVAGHPAMEVALNWSDKDGRRQPHMRALEPRSREGYGR